MIATNHSFNQKEQGPQVFRLSPNVGNAWPATMTNYMEMDNAMSASQNVITLTNHQRQETGPSVTTLAYRKTYSNMNPQTTTYQQNQTNQDHWTSGTYSVAGEWFCNYKYYVGHSEHITEPALYDRLQSNIATTNYCDAKRLQDKSKPEERHVLQHPQTLHQPPHGPVDEHGATHYGPLPGSQIYTHFNAEDYNQNPRVCGQQSQSGIVERYNPQLATYQENPSHPNQPTTVGASPSTSLYQHYQQNLALPSTFDDLRRSQADIWVGHPHYDSNKVAGNHQVMEVNHFQTNEWPTKTGTRQPHMPLYQNQESYYEYYATDCVQDQGYSAQVESIPFEGVPVQSSSSLTVTLQQIKPETEPNVRRLDPAGTQNRPPGCPGTVRTEQVNLATRKPPLRPVKVQSNQKDKRVAPQGTPLENSESVNQADRLNRLNQCRICGRHYARPSTLKTHLRTHTNERPYKCAACSKTFSQAANLTAHQRVHTGERPFPCPICGRQFSQSSSVITHLRTHSGERPYRCSMCSRTFSDSSTLTKHCRVHSGEKPYQCDYCPMNFSQSGNLSRHLRLHSVNGTSKTQQTPTSTTTLDANGSATTAMTPPATLTTNQRNLPSDPSSSPESTLSSYSVSSSSTSNSEPPMCQRQTNERLASAI